MQPITTWDLGLWPDSATHPTPCPSNPDTLRNAGLEAKCLCLAGHHYGPLSAACLPLQHTQMGPWSPSCSQLPVRGSLPSDRRASSSECPVSLRAAQAVDKEDAAQPASFHPWSRSSQTCELLPISPASCCRDPDTNSRAIGGVSLTILLRMLGIYLSTYR